MPESNVQQDIKAKEGETNRCQSARYSQVERDRGVKAEKEGAMKGEKGGVKRHMQR